jgi:hypothetical protein
VDKSELQSLRDSLRGRSLATSEGRETQPEIWLQRVDFTRVSQKTDAVDFFHADFETGYAEGANWKQVQLPEKNAKHIHWIGQEPGCGPRKVEAEAETSRLREVIAKGEWSR